MPNIVNYVTNFESVLKQKYTKELLTNGLTTQDVQFINANTIKIPHLVLKGFKDHSRAGGFNRQSIENKYMTKTLSHDRDVEFFVDAMDVDETNQVLAAARTTATFETEFAIPETDAYRLSKMYADFIACGGVVDATDITAANALSTFDAYMEAMDEAEVPLDGRILYVTPKIHTLLKQADEITRFMVVSGVNDGTIKRTVNRLDDVKIVQIPPGRMKTAYDFSDGYAPAVGAKQINMLLVQPKSVIACNKHSYIKLWPEGSHTQGDGYLYQNRQYWDLFVLDTRYKGIAMNVN